MTTIVCASGECKWNTNNKCTAKKINLSWCSIMTKHDGRQEYWKCAQYEMTPEDIEKFEKLKELFQNRK